MRGKHHIIIENNRVRYEFEIKRNITIIRGNSATGKTVLIEMLAEYQSYGKSSGILVESDIPIAVLDNRNWQATLEQYSQSIIFIDDGCRFVATQEFASEVKKADNYFVIVTRDNLPNLPYSIEEIYGIRTSQRYAGLKKTYNEFYHLYGDLELLSKDKIEQIVVEDPKEIWYMISENTAYLSNVKDYISFTFRELTIQFRGPYSLQCFKEILTWDRGYLVVMAKYSHSEEAIEDYIDLIPILENLYIDADSFLKDIERVEVRYA